MNRALYVLSLIQLLILVSCTTKLPTSVENRAPELIRILADLSVESGSSVALSMKYIEAVDKDGDDMNIVVHPGENYSVSDLIVTPDSGYVGDLSVPVQITDGSAFSDTGWIVISVVTYKTLMPLETGFWWEYNDYASGGTDTVISKLVVTGTDSFTVNETLQEVYAVEWSNLEEYDLTYFMSNTNGGTLLHGGASPTDTLEVNQYFRYPVEQGASWEYQELRYNATDGIFFSGITGTMTCTNDEIYVTVPAGVFRCVEYTVTTSTSRAVSAGVSFHGERGVSSRADGFVEKLYYSEGIGYVQKTISQGGTVVWKKELRDYNVVESLQEEL